MTFGQIPPGVGVFLDANSLIYHFTNDATFGKSCTQLVKRIEQKTLSGFTSAHCLADVAHRLMTIEAISVFGWPRPGIASRLRKNHSEIPKLTVYQQAIASVALLGIQILPITSALVEAATILCQKYQLLTGDGLIVAVMQHQALSHLASNDPDFDRVPGLTRFFPV